MSDNITLQEQFDAMTTFSPKDIGLQLSLMDLWYKHRHEESNPMFTAEYYAALEDIADKYGVYYKQPEKIGQLKEVGSPAVLH